MPEKERTEDLTVAQRAELTALAARSDEQINTRDISEVRDWSSAKRGVFYRTPKA